MKRIIIVFLTGILTALVFNACKKFDTLPFYKNGNAVTLTAAQTNITPKPADSTNSVLSFSWTSPKYSTDSSTFKYVIEIDSTGRNFAKRVSKTVSGALSASFTGKELNNILLNFGFQLGKAYGLDVRVLSSYANNNEQYTSNVVNVTVAAYGDSSTFSTSQTNVSGTLATAATHSLDFSWSASFNGYAGVVTYTIQYDSAGKGFASPKEITVGAAKYTQAMTQGDVNETALNSGIKGGDKGTVEYRVKATTAQGASVYSNVVNVTIQSYLPIVRFYLAGNYQAATGQGKDWDPPTAPELVRDLRASVFNDLYYIYIYLPAGTEFKITQGRAWDIAYGDAGGGSATTSGGNFKVSNAGYYRISFSRINQKFDIREGRMGFVGGAIGAGWTPGNVFPKYAMGMPATDLFVGLTDFTADGWKMIDNDQWNNGSNAVDETRSYGSSGGSGSTLDVNGGNFPNITTAGRYRVIWDGRNVDNVQYQMYPATEMRLVGNGIQGVNEWDPANSPQMTYKGNGVWQITANLIGGKDIKFLAGNAWGAFDYEDNSGGSTATGTPRKIRWDGSDNFKTPAASGSYTITLDENNQTVTIQ